jgi:hypothetical protein
VVLAVLSMIVVLIIFFYADDLCLMAPCSSALQKLIDICLVNGVDLDIVFNPEKSHFIVFKPSRFKLDLPPVFLNGQQLARSSKVKYLGVLLTENSRDDEELSRQKRNLYARCNLFFRKFKKCSDGVKRQLFLTYCSTLYCMPVWYKYSVASFSKLNVAYNNVFRSLFNLSRFSSASAMFVNQNVSSLSMLMRKSINVVITRVNRYGVVTRSITVCSGSGVTQALKNGDFCNPKPLAIRSK